MASILVQLLEATYGVRSPVVLKARISGPQTPSHAALLSAVIVEARCHTGDRRHPSVTSWTYLISGSPAHDIRRWPLAALGSRRFPGTANLAFDEFACTLLVCECTTQLDI